MKNYFNALLLTAMMSLIVYPAVSGDAIVKTVEAVNVEKNKLNGKKVQVKGKVVKVNNGIMKRNFLHIQDGTGSEGSNDLTVTSKQTANVGDNVIITGNVFLDRDFGFGYSYPILVEDSTIQKQ